jgi:hypothetical protein
MHTTTRTHSRHFVHGGQRQTTGTKRKANTGATATATVNGQTSKFSASPTDVCLMLTTFAGMNIECPRKRRTVLDGSLQALKGERERLALLMEGIDDADLVSQVDELRQKVALLAKMEDGVPTVTPGQVTEVVGFVTTLRARVTKAVAKKGQPTVLPGVDDLQVERTGKKKPGRTPTSGQLRVGYETDLDEEAEVTTNAKGDGTTTKVAASTTASLPIVPNPAANGTACGAPCKSCALKGTCTHGPGDSNGVLEVDGMITQKDGTFIYVEGGGD